MNFVYLYASKIGHKLKYDREMNRIYIDAQP